ncbi:MAG: wax ester/triacylglycerol synthase family O-acyltransferase [Myxococcota bacterium]|nr:wax ester/triacylglycerol synthase family O-acyltransferase [Myxococcota bacterium]
MRRLGGADALLLYLESPRVYMHTLKIAIVDPSKDPEGWSFERYRERFESRLHRLPPMRWRLAPTPLGLHHPLWIEDQDFNIDYHFRRVACPAPGDRRALCELISQVYAWPMDRSRPLWVMWVVEGLEDGRIATVMLLHHAYVDGIAAGYLLQQLCSEEPGGDVPGPAQPWQPEPWPPAWKRATWGLRDLPKMLWAEAPKTARGLRKRARHNASLRSEGKAAPASPADAPVTPLSVLLSHGRTFVCESFPLEDMKRVRAAFGVTINDVFLACCAAAVRRCLADRGFDPDTTPLVASVPLSQRKPEELPLLGNHTTVDYLWLRSDIGDPVERLHACHASADEMKAHFQATKGSDLASVAHILPPFVSRLLNRFMRSKQGRLSVFANIVVSNVPGPQKPLYFGHSQVADWYSMGQIFDGTPLNMTMWSYAGRVNLGILADRAVVPDGWVLVGYFRDALEELLEKVGSTVPSGEPAAAVASEYAGRSS